MAWEGAFGVAPPEVDGCVLSERSWSTRSTLTRSIPAYLSWYFKQQPVWEAIGSRSTGTNVRRRSLHPDVFEAFKVPLPPSGEQRRVVRRIGQLAARLTVVSRLQERATTESAAVRLSVLALAERSAAQRGDVRPLQDFVQSHDSGWSPQCEDRSAAAGEWAVLKTTSVQWDGFDPFANKALGPGLTPRPDSAVKAGDVLVTRAGPVNRVGVACVVLEDQPFRMLSDKIVRWSWRQACLPTMWLSCCVHRGPRSTSDGARRAWLLRR